MNFLDSYINTGLKIRSKQARYEFWGGCIEFYVTGEEPKLKSEAAQIAFEGARYSLTKAVAGRKGGKAKSEREDSATVANCQAKRENQPSKRPTKEEEEEGKAKAFLEEEEEEGLSSFGLLCLKALNDTLGTCYSQLPGKSARCLDRMDGRYTLDEVKAMIECKRDEWQGTRFSSNLTPNTLFSPDHFEQYIHQSKSRKEDDDEWSQYA